MAWAEDTALQRCTRSAVPRAKTEARAVSRPPGFPTFGIGTKASNLRGTMPRLLDRMSPLSSHQRRPNEIPVSAEPAQENGPDPHLRLGVYRDIADILDTTDLDIVIARDLLRRCIASCSRRLRVGRGYFLWSRLCYWGGWCGSRKRRHTPCVSGDQTDYSHNKADSGQNGADDAPSFRS